MTQSDFSKFTKVATVPATEFLKGLASKCKLFKLVYWDSFQNNETKKLYQGYIVMDKSLPEGKQAICFLGVSKKLGVLTPAQLPGMLASLDVITFTKEGVVNKDGTPKLLHNFCKRGMQEVDLGNILG